MRLDAGSHALTVCASIRYAAEGCSVKSSSSAAAVNSASNCAASLNDRSWTVQRFDRQSLDVTDAQRVRSAIAQADPQLVINAAAYNQVDIADRNRGRLSGKCPGGA